MKRRTLLILTIALLLLLSIDFRNSQAQYSVGADALFGAEEDFGLNLSGLYHFRDNIAVGAGAAWWPRSAPEDARYLLTELNAEFRLIPYSRNRLSLHVSAITGYHYSGVRLKSHGETFQKSDHMTAFGGAAGVTYNLGTVYLTAGVRNFITGFNQLGVNTGIQVRL